MVKYQVVAPPPRRTTPAPTSRARRLRNRGRGESTTVSLPSAWGAWPRGSMVVTPSAGPGPMEPMGTETVRRPAWGAAASWAVAGVALTAALAAAALAARTSWAATVPVPPPRWTASSASLREAAT